MATIWPAAAGAEPLELRTGGHRRGGPGGLRGGLAASGQRGAGAGRPGRGGGDPRRATEGLAASLGAWLDEGGFTPPERAAIVLHHARLETAFAGIASQAPQPDPATVQAWYLRHQAQFIRPEQRLTRHLLLTVDGDDQAVYSRIQALHGQIAASREAFAPLAQRHSHCPSALDGGLLGWIGRGCFIRSWRRPCSR